MFFDALMKVLHIYGITIVVSMVVAVLIKVLVMVTGRVNAPAKAPVVTTTAKAPVALPKVDGIPEEVVAAISAALAVVTGSHRILHIAESKRSWSHQGRIAQHSHNPR